MSLHYMFCIFCSTWHVAVKLICSHLFSHNMIEARHSNVSTCALPYGSTVCLLLQNAGLDFKTLPYDSIPHMQPMSIKMSIDKQTTSSLSRRSTKSSQLRDIYAMCKSMNNQLKIVRQQCDCSIAAWKALHPDALPLTSSQTDDKEDGDDDCGDEEDENASTNGE